MNINDLKAQAYDTLAQIEMLQMRLKQLNLQIMTMMKEKQDESGKTTGNIGDAKEETETEEQGTSPEKQNPEERDKESLVTEWTQDGRKIDAK